MKKELGLVLSGGGLRGVAHIGVLKCFEEHDIKPDYIAGTSAGAVIGALYAAGRNTEEIINVFQKNNIFKLTNYAFRKPGIIDILKFREVLTGLIPEDSFDKLPIKLFVVGSCLTTGKARIFHRGALIEALLATIAIPFLFTPVEIEGELYADGGIFNNFPVEPLTGICDVLVGVHVNPINPLKKEDLRRMLTIAERAFQLSVRSTSVNKFGMCDVVIEPKEINRFGMFRIKDINEIYQMGYDEATRQVPKIKQMLKKGG